MRRALILGAVALMGSLATFSGATGWPCPGDDWAVRYRDLVAQQKRGAALWLRCAREERICNMARDHDATFGTAVTLQDRREMLIRRAKRCMPKLDGA